MDLQLLISQIQERLSQLSPLTTFTLVSGFLVIVYFGFFSGPRQKLGPPPTSTPRPPPVQLGDVTPEVLIQYNGSDDSKPLLMAIKGTIYDVSRGSGFYGPGGPYEAFAGKDASCALAKMSFEPEDIDNPDVSGLTYSEMETLNDWEMRFNMKYNVVGKVVREGDLPPPSAAAAPPPSPMDAALEEGSGESSHPVEELKEGEKHAAE